MGIDSPVRAFYSAIRQMTPPVACINCMILINRKICAGTDRICENKSIGLVLIFKCNEMWAGCPDDIGDHPIANLNSILQAEADSEFDIGSGMEDGIYLRFANERQLALSILYWKHMPFQILSQMPNQENRLIKSFGSISRSEPGNYPRFIEY